MSASLLKETWDKRSLISDILAIQVILKGRVENMEHVCQYDKRKRNKH